MRRLVSLVTAVLTLALVEACVGATASDDGAQTTRDELTSLDAVDGYFASESWRATPAGTLSALSPLALWQAASLPGVEHLVGSRYSTTQLEAPNPYRTFCFPLAATVYARAYAAAHPAQNGGVHDVTEAWILSHGIRSSVAMLEQLPDACQTSPASCVGGPITLDDVDYSAAPLDLGTLQRLPLGEPLLIVARPLDRARIGHWVVLLKGDDGTPRIYQQAPRSYVSLQPNDDGQGGAFRSTFATVEDAQGYVTGLGSFVGLGHPTLVMAVRVRQTASGSASRPR